MAREAQESLRTHGVLRARLAENLRQARAGRRWSQEVAAERSHMILQQYQRLESGRANWTATTLERVMTGFGVTAADLLAEGAFRARVTPAAPAVGDPVAQLLATLETHGRPPPSWVIHWSHADQDPLRQAWVANVEDCGAMLRVLLYARARRAWARASAAARAVTVGDPVDYDRRCCAAVRAAVPAPPTLRELLRKWKS